VSTRSCIARPSDDHLFEGVYVHWDGYPSGVGAALHAAVKFFGSAELAALYLIDDHPAGWSSLASADLKLPLRRRSSMPEPDSLCRICKRSHWRHYAQYYESHGLKNPGPAPDGTSHVFDHGFDGYPDPLAGAACPFPDNEKPEQPLRGDGDDWGTEYAYVIHPTHMTIYDRVWTDGDKMIGMFGSGAGAREGSWRLVMDWDWDVPFEGDVVETKIRLHHELNQVAKAAGLGDKTGTDT